MYKRQELKTKLYLFQALPKQDKMEFIVQKAVELGAHEIIPVASSRCVVKLDDKKRQEKKLARWQIDVYKRQDNTCTLFGY